MRRRDLLRSLAVTTCVGACATVPGLGVSQRLSSDAYLDEVEAALRRVDVLAWEANDVAKAKEEAPSASREATERRPVLGLDDGRWVDDVDTLLKSLFVALIMAGAARDLDYPSRPNERFSAMLQERDQQLDAWAAWSRDAMDELLESSEPRLDAMVADGGDIDDFAVTLEAWASGGDVPVGLRRRALGIARDIKREARRMRALPFFRLVSDACDRQLAAHSHRTRRRAPREDYVELAHHETATSHLDGWLHAGISTHGPERPRFASLTMDAPLTGGGSADGIDSSPGDVPSDASPHTGASALPPLDLPPYRDTRTKAPQASSVPLDKVPRNLARVAAVEGERVVVIFDDGDVRVGTLRLDRRHAPPATVFDSGSAVWIIDLTRVSEIHLLDSAVETEEVRDEVEVRVPKVGDFIQVESSTPELVRGWVTYVDARFVELARPDRGSGGFVRWRGHYRDARGRSLVRFVTPRASEGDSPGEKQDGGIALVGSGAALVVGGTIAGIFTIGIGSIAVTPGIVMLIVGGVKLHQTAGIPFSK